jgi:ABC-type amino acid transport substrate-binding protein
MRNVFILILGLIAASQTAVAASDFIVSYRTPVIRNTTSTYHDYYTALLKLALEKTRPTYGDYKMEGVPPSTSLLRSLSDAVDNIYPNLAIEAGYEEKLTDSGMLTYINIPIDGGIFGYRVCFTNAAIKEQLKKVNSVNDLRKYTIAQGVAWVDTEILRANDLTVIEISNFEGIFKMVAAGRIDLFCRGTNQLQDEVKQFKSLTKLTYDESFVLVYPLPRFFYLNAKNTLAKERIQAGLQIAFKDGSFKKLWKKHYQSSVDFSKLDQRKHIYLKNPLLKKLPPDYKQYFMDPLSE